MTAQSQAADQWLAAHPFSGSTIVYSNGPDNIAGNDQNISYFANGGNDTVDARGGSDRLDGGDGLDDLNGGMGDDYIFGGADFDLIHGGEGNDYLVAGPGGSDLLEGGAGDDLLLAVAGGGVFDLTVYHAWAYFTGGNADLFVDLRVANVFTDLGYSKSATLGTDKLGGISNVQGNLDQFSNTIYGNSLDNRLWGGTGADTLSGEGGNDTLDGGGIFDPPPATGADLLFGGDGDDVIIGHSLNDTVYGGTGDDRIDTYQGADYIDAGSGDDTVGADYTISDGDQADTVYGGGGNDEIYALTGGDLLYGQDGNDLIYAGFDQADAPNGDGADTVYSGIGDDTAHAGSGDDQVYGQNGRDVIYLDYGKDLGDGGDGHDWIDAGNDNDILYGRTGDDTLHGGEGDDSVYGNEQNDTLYLENGNDFGRGGDGNDLIDGGDGDDVIFGSLGNNTLHGGSGNDRLAGEAGTDQLFGEAGNDTINGLAGIDTMTGGAGNELYYVSDAGDVIIEGVGGGKDLVRSSVTYTLAANIETLQLDTSGINGTGNDQNNTIRAYFGNNQLYGMGGNDSLNGGVGQDFLSGGLGNDKYYLQDRSNGLYDVVDENAGEGTDTVYVTPIQGAANYYALTTDVENGVLVGTDAFGLTGNAGNNRLDGNAAGNILVGAEGNDYLDGNLGYDQAIGGDGDDRYYVDYTNIYTPQPFGPPILTDVLYDIVTEAANGGNDTVIVELAAALKPYYILGDNIENGIIAAVATGTALVGNALDNRLTGNFVANSLAGGAGKDTFVFTDPLAPSNVDVISDFKPADDTIQLENSYIGFFETLPTGPLAVGAFNTGTTATQADDRIIYDLTSGSLYYDSDGLGGVAAIKFAILSNKPVDVNAADFVVI